ncbi:hypothetical protein [Haloprofundus halophilus]|uniref:hypothetical protein n=1 Tax=Haloprofundus halophilus TaxID=2283527 RepID=UPI000E4370C5|nr:hypothetical protein [Haloprofundus halophilus]
MARNDTSGRAETTRRGLLRAAGVSVAGLAATSVPAAVGSAQTVTTTAAISGDAPTFSGTDYTGLFVHVRGVSNDQSVSRLDSCDFFGGDDEAIVYIVRLIDRTADDHPSEETLLYAVEGTDELGVGNLYVVSNQQSCGGPLVELELESVGASTINVSTGDGGGAATESGSGEESTATGGEDTADDGETTGSTETTTPGFGPLAAAAGLGGAALWFGRSTDRE